MTPLAEVTSYDTLIDALRQRKAMLGLTDAGFEACSGLAHGHAGKLLGAAHTKTLGPKSLGKVLKGLAVKLVVVEDVEAAKKMMIRWEKRKRPLAMPSAPSMAFLKREFAPTLRRHLSKIGRKGGEARKAKVGAKTLSRIGRAGARARWRRDRGKRARAVNPPAGRAGGTAVAQTRVLPDRKAAYRTLERAASRAVTP